MNIAQTLASAKQNLTALDAEVLLAHVLCKPRTYLMAYPEAAISEPEYLKYNQLIQRCQQGEPVAYLTNRREFWSLDLEVTTDTLIPRPETELLVECALKLFAHKSGVKAADLGTGSGAIALALAKEKPDWQLFATDISEKALALASKNAQRLKLNNLSFYLGNWCTALPGKDFDLIISNPPYIAETEWQDYKEGLSYEPRGALVSGHDGLMDLRMIAMAAKTYLKPEGYVIVEHGFTQGNAVRTLFRTAGLKQIETVQDLSGHERITLGRNYNDL